jgi:release factor glutamine methyltransferase
VSTTDKPRTVLQVIQAATDYLAGKGIDNARLACEHLASRLLGCKRLELYLRFNEELTDKHLDAMRRGVKRLASHEPLQYILGQWDFMGHTFKCDPRALIPRPETEQLVAAVLECEQLRDGRPVILDLGTGSGCIAISLALARPEADLLACDTSPEALALARANARGLGADERIRFLEGDLSDKIEPESLDAIVANLPYIPTAACEQLPEPVRAYEPRRALDGGPDGLTVIEQAAQEAAIMLRPGGMLFLEIGEEQGEAVEALLEACGFHDIRLRQDLNGRDRIVEARAAG